MSELSFIQKRTGKTREIFPGKTVSAHNPKVFRQSAHCVEAERIPEIKRKYKWNVRIECNDFITVFEI